jgi:hypothetical protein
MESAIHQFAGEELEEGGRQQHKPHEKHFVKAKES